MKIEMLTNIKKMSSSASRSLGNDPRILFDLQTESVGRAFQVQYIYDFVVYIWIVITFWLHSNFHTLWLTNIFIRIKNYVMPWKEYKRR